MSETLVAILEGIIVIALLVTCVALLVLWRRSKQDTTAAVQQLKDSENKLTMLSEQLRVQTALTQNAVQRAQVAEFVLENRKRVEGESNAQLGEEADRLAAGSDPAA